MTDGARGRAQRAFFAALAFLLLVGGLEGVLRLAKYPPLIDSRYRTLIRSVDNDLGFFGFLREDPALFWSPRPGYRDERIRINALGMRDGPVTVARTAGRLRILCLGDSVTWGWKLPLEQSWGKVLEARLREALGPTAVEVLNLGVTGYTSFQGLEYFRRRGAPLSPDLVIACFGFNDSLCRFPYGDREIFAQSPAALRLASAAHGLATYRLLRSLLVPRLPVEGRRYVRRVPPALYEANLVALAREVRSQGARLVLLAYPHVSRRVKPWPDGPAYRDALRRAARASGALLAEIPELSFDAPPSNRDLFLPRDPVHPNPRGHALIAERLARRLLDAGLAKRPGREGRP